MKKSLVLLYKCGTEYGPIPYFADTYGENGYWGSCGYWLNTYTGPSFSRSKWGCRLWALRNAILWTLGLEK